MRCVYDGRIMGASHRVGIVGGGQLARMTGLAAARLGVEIVVLDPDPHCPAGAAGAEVLVGDPADFDLLRQLASRTDVLTLDHENVSVDHLRQLEQLGVRGAPGSVVAEMAIDKLRSRTRFREEGFPVPEVAEVSVVGRPNAEWGEEVVAFVVCRMRATLPPEELAAQLDALCRASIARFKRPKRYELVSELPKNNYGKVLKTELRKRLTDA